MFTKKQHKGEVTVEFVVTSALVIIVLGTALISLFNQGSTQAGEMGTWISGVAVPTGP